MDEIDLSQWVAPFYLQILHGNFATTVISELDRERFNSNVMAILPSFTPEIASRLISMYWREAITGSWFAGLLHYDECQSQIGELLLASRTCYAGQSHAFAMACFQNQASVDFLTRYLDTYLPRLDCEYDQGWAIGALMWIDHVNKEEHSERFLGHNGLWDQFTANRHQFRAWGSKDWFDHISKLMSYCKVHFGLPS